MTSILAPSLVTEATPTFDPTTSFPEDTSRKGQTRKRLQQEFDSDLAYTAGQVRHILPSPSGSSRNPNHVLAFNFVNDHFLNREAHEEAVAIVEGWKPEPWKGQIWRGLGKDNIERVWTGPVHFDLIWSGSEWLPCNTSHSSADGSGAVDFNFPATGMREVTSGCVVTEGGVKGVKPIFIPRTGEYVSTVNLPKALIDTAKVKAAKDLNAAWVLYDKNRVGQKESFYMTLSAYVRGVFSNQVFYKLSNRAELDLDRDDVLGEFLLKITSLIESGKYAHQGKIENWLGYQWCHYHLPEMLTEIQSYLDRTTFVNLTNTAGDKGVDKKPNVEEQKHSDAIEDVEKEEVRRQREGYYFPISRDRLFREMNPITQNIVRMLCEGLSIPEIAVRVDITPRQLRRRVGVAAQDGQAVLDNVLQTLHACADDDNLLEWPEQGIDIQASSVRSENKLVAMVEAFETAITAAQLATILQCSRREIYKLIDEKRIPALKVGTMIRLDPYQIAEWIMSKMTIAA
ncbi:helix-turn-helix domain-containing protein [Tunturibacter empetritectus]|uniref:Excisionase family DNA binding protein n=1 Tax=Tunturiibacter lichenicola TaxID=2051959 RepID=A0A7W8JBE4_9BACT|nr:helix-turn-helix domain-containing protein [Edaphobacter lichenicola]MBB5345868.1 excisionase family DNA binding protein [Edaphobacter lichenicola]